jgi:hypothetical protein
MRVRKVDANGDMTFGASQANYWINHRAGVGLAVSTRLELWLGQWFLNTSDGTPWMTKVLGRNTSAFRDAAVQSRILGTPGVNGISAYASQLNRTTREFDVQASIDTAYGQFEYQGTQS